MDHDVSKGSDVQATYHHNYYKKKKTFSYENKWILKCGYVLRQNKTVGKNVQMFHFVMCNFNGYSRF